MSTPRGKIGRLPVALRIEVNKFIRDNCTAESIIDYLEDHGVKGVSPQNLSAWKANGYLAWERNQQRLEDMSARREFAVALAQEVRADGDQELSLASNAASALAVDAIQQVLEDFDPGILKAALAEKPEKFMALVESLASLRKGDQDFVKVKIAFEQYRAKVKAQVDELSALADQKGGATKDDIAAIFKEAYQV